MNKIETTMKELRKFKGYTQQRLADEVGKSVDTIINWENQKTSPSILDFYKLNQILNDDNKFFLKFNQVKVEKKEQK